MSDRPMYHVSNHAVKRFIERFDSGLKDKKKIKKLLNAMAVNGWEHLVGKNGYNTKCITAKERRTGRRVFLCVEPNAAGDTWYVIKTVLTQEQACKTYGFTYPKETS